MCVVDKILIDLHKMSFDAGAERVTGSVFTGNMAQGGSWMNTLGTLRVV